MKKLTLLIKLINSNSFISLFFAFTIVLSSVVIIALILIDPQFLAKINKNPEQVFAVGFSVIIAFIAVSRIPRFLAKNETRIDSFQNNYFNIHRSISNSLTKARINQIVKRRINNQKNQNPSPYDCLIKIVAPIEENTQIHINKLQNNSIVNLTIGIIGTIITITVLSLTLLTERSYQSIQDFVINFIPRLSFVIIIQLFAFFFLRLYKSNLDDTKYFQNELTNIMAKTIALKIAYQQDDKTLIIELTKDLFKVERNFKLAAGESLLNIEKHKIEKDYDVEILRNIKDLLIVQKQKSQENN